MSQVVDYSSSLEPDYLNKLEKILFVQIIWVLEIKLKE